MVTDDNFVLVLRAVIFSDAGILIIQRSKEDSFGAGLYFIQYEF